MPIDDEFEEGMHACVRIDVELDVKGDGYKEVLPRAAHVLRALATKVENDLETGHHDVHDSSGRKVGTIYLDHYGEGF